MGCDEVDEVSKVDGCGRENESSKQVNEHDESHTEAAEATQVLEEHKLSQVVDSRVNPTTSLGHENLPCFWSSCAGICIWNELVRHVREVFGHKSGEESIFSKGQQVLLM